MTFVTKLAVGLVLIFPFAACADDSKKPMEKLQGTWLPVSYEIGGLKLEGEGLKAAITSIAIKGSAFEWKAGDSNDKGTIKVDAAKNPMHIDFVSEQEGGIKITAWAGIYSVEGDTLKFCVGPGSAQRPKDFSTTGTAYGLFTLKRAK